MPRRKKNGGRSGHLNAQLGLGGARFHREERPETAAIRKYGPVESRKRLEACGFDKRVTDLSLEEYMEAWNLMANLLSRRPTREDFLQAKSPMYFHRGVYSYSVHMVKLWADPPKTVNDKWELPGGDVISEAFRGVPFTQALAIELSSGGFADIQSLALAWRQAYLGIAREMTIYDCVQQKFLNKEGKVFLALNPEYTVGDARTDARRPNTDVKWLIQERESQTIVANMIEQAHQQTSIIAPVSGSNSISAAVKKEIWNFIFHERLVNKIQALSIADIDGMGSISQMQKGLDDEPFRVYDHKNVSRLRSLLKAIFKRKDNTQVLHLQKIPFVDRRIVAIILRACPRITMVAIYDCPLIEFPDVICFLDLIHEINGERRAKEQPEIEAFDFFPHYEAGMPYHHAEPGTSRTYGITWLPYKNEIVQRGFFRIILEAVLKSHRLKLKLLFDKDKALRNFLFRVPGLPMAVPSFLDGLYRYLDVAIKRSADVNTKKQALYDMLKAVRLGVEGDIGSDWPRFYQQEMGCNLVFCSSCGYEMLEEFFTYFNRGMDPLTRQCSGCQLRFWIDEESAHYKQKKLGSLKKLFPEWDPFKFNQDAQTDTRGSEIFRLKTAESVPSPTPGLRVNSEGFIGLPQHRRPYSRNNKLHWDSLQDLPALSDLVDDEKSSKKWASATWEAMFWDAEIMVDHKLAGPEFGGVCSHFDEPQQPAKSRFRENHSFETAVDMHQFFQSYGY